MAILQRVKYRTMYDSESHLGSMLKRIENWVSSRYLYSSQQQHSQQLKDGSTHVVTDRWMMYKTRCTHMRKYRSALKKKGILTHATTLRPLC